MGGALVARLGGTFGGRLSGTLGGSMDSRLDATLGGRLGGRLGGTQRPEFEGETFSGLQKRPKWVFRHESKNKGNTNIHLKADL